MIRLAGEFSLVFAFFLALLQSSLPLIGYWKNNPYLLATARPCAYLQFIFIVVAYCLLTFAFVTNDFSIAYVALNSHPNLPFMYRLTAVWGAHEGSILFWVLILNSWTIAFSLLSKHYPQALTLAMLGILSAAFLAFILLTSNPFLAAPFATSGQDLNPLLQDPGFVIHPPLLYIGYVGFAVAFAITQAAFISGKLNSEWARITRHYAIAAWCFLTIGIALGSWWAYRVLGWGGFWFWDPVENASLLPWLSGTALIHILLLVEKRDVAKMWAALLAITTFILSVFGTLLVRSGILVSAHSFAQDPERGVFLLILLAFILVLTISLFIYRATKQIPTTIQFQFLSRETSLLLNSGVLFLAMLTVLLGTIYPLILDALQLGTISVGAPYFNLVMTPIIFCIMLLMGLGGLVRWQQQPIKPFLSQCSKNLLISTLIAFVLLFAFTQTINFIALSSLALSIWILLSIIANLKQAPGMAFAHAGFAILVIGIMLSSILSLEKEVRIKPGDLTEVGPYKFLFIDTSGISGSNYRGIQAAFDVIKGDKHITNLYPEKRIYTVREMVMTNVAIHPGIFRDLYIAIGEPLEQDYWSVRIYYKPFMRWIWFGGVVMMLGGVITLFTSTRKRLLK